MVALATSFLSSAFPGLTRDPKLREEISSLLCSHSTGHGFAFAVGESFHSKASSDLFRHGALLPNHQEIHNIEQTKKVIPFIS